MDKKTSSKDKRKVPLIVRIFIVVFAIVFIVFMIVSLVPFGPSVQKPQEDTAAPDNTQDYIAELLDQAQKEPRNVVVLTELGYALFDVGRYQDAIFYYGKVLEIVPDNNFVRTDMGAAYFYLGDPAAAIDEFDKVLEMDPEFKQAVFYSAVVYEQTGNIEKAIDFYKRFLDIAPDDPIAEQVKLKIKELQDTLE